MMALLVAVGHHEQDDADGAVIAEANNARDGLARNFATTDSRASGRSEIWKASGVVLLLEISDMVIL